MCIATSLRRHTRPPTPHKKSYISPGTNKAARERSHRISVILNAEQQKVRRYDRTDPLSIYYTTTKNEHPCFSGKYE
jgi:hypothetical protein